MPNYSVFTAYSSVMTIILTFNCSGCLQLLEILEIWNLIGPPGNFCVRCRRSTALVSSHKTGYQIALFYLCYGPMLYKMYIILLFYI